MSQWSQKYYSEWEDADGNINRLDFYLWTSSTFSVTKLQIQSFKQKLPKFDFFGEDVMYGTGVEIGIICEELYALKEDFYQVDPMGMRVKHTLTTPQGTIVNFDGFIDTEQFEEPISKQFNYPVIVSANNGFAVLDRLKFYNPNGTMLGGMTRYLDIFKLCIQKLRIPISHINVGIYTYPFGSTSLDALTPGNPPYYSILQEPRSTLHVLFANADNFYDELEQANSCREVLEALLIVLGAKMFYYDGQIYIADIECFQRTPMPFKKYQISNLALVPNYIGPAETGTWLIGPSQITSISVQLTPHSSIMKPGKNEAAFHFNKYNYPNPYPLLINQDTVFGLNETVDIYINDDIAYRELRYASVKDGVYERMGNVLATEFVERQSFSGTSVQGTSSEFFVRINEDITSGYRLRIHTGRFVSSAIQFIGLSGQVMLEDLSHYMEERDMSPITRGWSFMFRANLHETDKGATLVNKHMRYIPAGGGYGHNRWTDQISNTTDWTWMEGALLDAPRCKYNKWYDLNGGINFPVYWIHNPDPSPLPPPYGSGATYLTAPIIPLFNRLHDTAVGIKGGYLSIDIFLPASGTEYYKNLCIKDFTVTLLTMPEEKRFNVEQATDSIFRGYMDPLYKDSVDISTIVGTDDINFSRGGVFVEVTGSYEGSPGTNLRYAILNQCRKMLWINNASQLRVGRLEHLVLNSYMSNLKQVREVLSTNLKGYYNLFQSFQFPLIQRDGQVCRLIPIEMEIDFVEARTKIELMEIVKDDVIPS